MQVSEETSGAATVLTVEGRVDQATSGDLEKVLLAKVGDGAPGGIVIDMSQVAYISSVGLWALMVTAKAAKKAQRSVVVAAPTDMVKEVFTITKFHYVMKSYDTREDALAAVA